PEGALVSRREPGAVIEDVHAVAARALRMAVDGTVEATDGSEVRVDARSICVHGDTPGAVELATAVRTTLERADVRLGPFA
ncbi:MAG: LamB/YcsF family protein, partial [Actinoallomurus sp.]